MVVQRPKLLELLEEHINISELIPVNWFFHYNKDIGRPHNNSLESIVSSLLLQKMLSIPTIDLLITFLSFSKELRDFCGLKSIPDASFYSKFKQLYCNDIEAFFHKLVDLTEPICQEIGNSLKNEFGFNPAELYIFDTTGIQCFVKENNPKFFNALVKKLQSLNKDKSKVDIYKMAYHYMPKSLLLIPI